MIKNIYPEKQMRLHAVALSAAIMVIGCAGQQSYVRPSTSDAPMPNSVVINKPRDAVWAAAVPKLGAKFFMINNMDKASGLINLSYAGDPGHYIDCGTVTSYVKNARGERTYEFPGQSAQQNYEVMDMSPGLLKFIDRRMALEGRVNLIFEELPNSQTRVTAQARYVVTRSQSIRTPDGRTGSANDVGSFNTAGMGSIGGGSFALECRATGVLEREILTTAQ